MFGLSYWFLPLFAGCVWLGTLLAMVGHWAASGEPHYAWQGPTDPFPYISDIAATSWGYPLFIAGSATMVVTFNLAFISERWLRHKGRLAQNYSKSEKVLSVLAIVAACIGAAGLVLLTIFDVRRHHIVHDSMLVVFIAGYWVSAIFICAEYQRLGVKYREHTILAVSFWIKLFFILVELALVIAFGSLSKEKKYYASAPIEWAISLVYIFYVWSFIIDFLPATRTRNREDRFPAVKKGDDEMAEDTERGGNLFGGPVYTSGGHAGQANGHANGHANGYANGTANGTASQNF